MNTLITPGSGNISFSNLIAAGSNYLPPLSASARIAYTKDGGLTIVSTASSSERFNVEGNFGNLLTVNDAATGRLFVINDISGFPLFFISDNGSLSSASVIFASGGNSDDWNSTQSTVRTLSTICLSTASSVSSLSALWTSSVATVSSLSGSWSSVYSTVQSLSNSWEESAEILPTVTNYLSTSNVSISALTVTRNLSVGGTIFSSATALVIANFETLIGNSVNSSFTVNHNLNTDKLQVTVYDVNTNIASYPSIQIINSNSISIGFGFIPSTNSYRVLVNGLVPSNQINAYGQIITIFTTATGFGQIPVLSGNWNSTYQTVCALSALWSQGGQNAGTSSYTVTAQDFIMTGSSSWAVDTLTSTVIGTLPSSPTSGMTIRFLDANKTWATNNFTIIRSGELIESLAENLNCDISGYSFSMTYIGGAIGWRIY